MAGNYFFIDGSALTSQIRLLRKKESSFNDRKLDPALFVHHFTINVPRILRGGFKRATFYFPTGDEAAIDGYIIVPDHKKPGAVRDLHFKFCGHKLKGAAEFTRIVEEHVPEKYHNRVNKSEKGIDIEICCDALKLASAGKIDRLFLLTNDDDFIPFCRTMKEFGANISIIHLSALGNCNASLVKEADSYDVVPVANLHQMFLPVPSTPLPEAKSTTVEEDTSALKADAAPSDLKGDEPNGPTDPLDAEPEPGPDE